MKSSLIQLQKQVILKFPIKNWNFLPENVTARDFDWAKIESNEKLVNMYVFESAQDIWLFFDETWKIMSTKDFDCDTE